MIKETIILLFYIFCSFTLLVCGEKNILPNLTNSQEPEPVFWPLGAGAGAEAARKKNTRSWSRLGKKIKIRKTEPLKNLPAPSTGVKPCYQASSNGLIVLYFEGRWLGFEEHCAPRLLPLRCTGKRTLTSRGKA